MLQIFPHVVFFATSRGKFFYLAREIIFAIFAFLTISAKMMLKFHYTSLAFLGSTILKPYLRKLLRDNLRNYI